MMFLICFRDDEREIFHNGVIINPRPTKFRSEPMSFVAFNGLFFENITVLV